MIEEGYSRNMRGTEHRVKRHAPHTELTTPRGGESAVRSVRTLLQRRDDFLDVVFFRVQGSIVRFAPIRVQLAEVVRLYKSRKQNDKCDGSKQNMPMPPTAIQKPFPNASKADAHQEKRKGVKATDEPMQLNVFGSEHRENHAPR